LPLCHQLRNHAAAVLDTLERMRQRPAASGTPFARVGLTLAPPLRFAING
jgi:hypothetical protein